MEQSPPELPRRRTPTPPTSRPTVVAAAAAAAPVVDMLIDLSSDQEKREYDCFIAYCLVLIHKIHHSHSTKHRYFQVVGKWRT